MSISTGINNWDSDIIVSIFVSLGVVKTLDDGTVPIGLKSSLTIVNEDFKPIGTVPSSRVLTTPRDTKMETIMSESQLLIPVEMDKEEVANLFENYNLNSAAVVYNCCRVKVVIFK